MKDKIKYPEATNVFEVALYDAFRRLRIGEPDKKVRKAIDKASRKVTAEVKKLMKQIRKDEAKQIKAQVKKNAEKKAGKKAPKTPAVRRQQADIGIVENIMA